MEKINMKRYLIEIGCSEEEIQQVKAICEIFKFKELHVYEMPKKVE